MFLETIPPELRIEIYRHIVERTIVTKAESPHEYRGLIFSCKEVHAEYRFEADKLVKPIKADVDGRWRFWPELKIGPSPYTCPMQIHVSIPLEVLRLTDRERATKLSSIIPALLEARTRVIFSLHDSEFLPQLNSNNASSDIERDWYGLAQLYNSICCAILKFKMGTSGGFVYTAAAERWAKKGYKLATKSNIPIWKCKHVALHAQNRIVVYDAHMSGEELEGASSGHLWTEENLYLY